VDTVEKSVEIVKPRRTWLRWLKRIGKLVLLAVIAIAIRQAWHHHEITKKLQETLAEMDRTEPGWQLEDIEAARMHVPEEENSARVVVAAAELLPRNWPPPEFHDRFAHLPPEEQLAPEDFARLKQELEQVRPALDEARKLATMPRGRHRIAYKRNVLNTMLEDQQRSRQVVHLLLCNARQCEQRQDMKSALISCQAALNAARSLGDEPLAVSQLVRSAGVFLACQGIERALAQGEPAAADLAGLRKQLADEEGFPDSRIVARGERAIWNELFDALESGDVSFAEAAGGDAGWSEGLFGFVYRDNVREQHPIMLTMLSRWVTIAQLPMPEQMQAERQLEQEIREVRVSAPLAALPLAAVAKMGDASRRKHALIRCTIAALATECYRQQHKKWPDSLDKLCPRFLEAMPRDPIDDEALRYRRMEDGVVIYSVSSDGVDNNGNLDGEHSNQPGADIGIRLWDVGKRRQLPRPKPRSPNPG
jgi:hypothetical protein